MAVRLGDAFVRIFADDRDLDKGLAGARQKTQSASQVMQGVFQGVGQAIFSTVKAGIRGAIDEIGKAVKASSDLSESVNQAGQIFGSSADKILAFASTADSALGQSKRQALDALGTFATFGKSAGLSGQALVDFSTKFDTLASDMASFKNTSPEEAITAIGAALRGESEPIRRYSVLLDEATLRQSALKLGIVTTTDQALTPQQRVLAATAEIYRQTSDLQGDFALTSEGLANAQRRLASEIENGSAKLGDSFRPAVESITNLLVGLAPQMFQYAQNITDQFANGLAAGIRAIIPVITTIRQLFTYWFAPGSPPRVLPDIDKWGAAAMGQFLKGFSSVDVKSAFAGVGSAIEQILRSEVSAGKSDENGLVGRILGSQSAIVAAVQEFKSVGSVSESTLQRIVRSAGSAGGSMAALVKAYFDVQRASDAATRAQDQLNRVTEKYDAILNPLRDQLDSVRAQQQKLADQQRLIAAKNTLANFDATEADKQAARLEIQQISLEDQISTVEQQKKAESDKAQSAIDNAKQEEAAAQKKLDIAQATIDQQVQLNNLLGEQRQLEERLAQQREADAKRAQSEAEAAANKAKQESEQAQRLADQLHQAQLQYNLELSDTPGKIKLMEAELAKTQVGSVEYYQILTQIHQLQEQYNHELEQAAKKAGALSDPALGAGIDSSITQSLGEASAAGQNLAKALEEAFAPLPPASEKVQNLADKIETLVNKLAALFGIDLSAFTAKNKEALQFSGDEWDHYEERVRIANDGATNSFSDFVDGVSKNIDDLNNLFLLFHSISVGDWTAAWGAIKSIAENNFQLTGGGIIGFLSNATTNFNQWFAENTAGWGQWFADTSKAMGQWLTDTANQISQAGSDLYKAGEALLGGFWDGLKSKWDEISTWFTDKLASLRAQLPFSEPKDPASPLRGLAQSGAAMIDMIQSGINAASLNINPLADSLLPAGATTNNSTANNMTFNINISGGDVTGIKQGARDGILEALRASGVR